MVRESELRELRPERLAGQGLDIHQYESGDRTILALLAETPAADQVDLVATWRDDSYEIWSRVAATGVNSGNNSGLKGIGYVGNAPPKGKGGANSDWTHANGMVYSTDDHNLLLSMRHQNWILKIEFLDGKVQVVKDGKVIASRDLPQPKLVAEEAWRKQVAAMPPGKQVDAVAARLKELNPGFDGTVTPKAGAPSSPNLSSAGATRIDTHFILAFWSYI